MSAIRPNIQALPQVEKNKLIEQIYNRPSYFQTLFNTDQQEFDCRDQATSLRQHISRLLLEKKLIAEEIRLENLHDVLSPELKAYNFNDGVNKISTFFYETDLAFQRDYFALIKHIRAHLVKEAFWFQATPTLRLHCPQAENSHHYPRYHSDISYGHPPEEINIWLPLTEVMEGHGFKIMSLADSKASIEKFAYDFDQFIDSAIHDKNFSAACDDVARPVATAFEKALAFDSRCIHSGLPLQNHTRISLDIRILPVARYELMEIEFQGSGRRKIIFAPGHCYHEKNSDQLL